MVGIKQTLGMGFTAGVLGVSLVGGGTFALFSDETKKVEGTIKMGTVSLNDESISSFNVSNLVPGDGQFAESTKEKSLISLWNYSKEHNDESFKQLDYIYDGSAPAWVTIKEFTKKFGSTELDKNHPSIFEVVAVTVKNTDFTKIYTKFQLDELPIEIRGNLEKNSRSTAEFFDVKQGDKIKVYVRYGLDRNAGNEYQNKSWTLGLSLYAVQKEHVDSDVDRSDIGINPEVKWMERINETIN